jgi:hypothetical protein
VSCKDRLLTLPCSLPIAFWNNASTTRAVLACHGLPGSLGAALTPPEAWATLLSVHDKEPVEQTRPQSRPDNKGEGMTVVTDFGIDFSQIGPAVGERFPDVILPDQNGTTVSLHQARGGRRALVVFHRSAGW